MLCRLKPGLLCATLYVSSDHLTERKPCRNGCMQTSFLLCERELVLLQVTWRKEILVTTGAAKRLVSCVQHLMFFSGNLTERKACRTECRHTPPALRVRVYVSSGYLVERKPCNTGCRQTPSLACEWACASSGHLTEQNPCCIGCRHTFSPPCVKAYESWGDLTERKPCRTGWDKLFLSCVWELVSLQLTLQSKSLVALDAGKRHNSCTGHLVGLKAT